MTLVEITYELQAPLSNEQLQDLGGFEHHQIVFGKRYSDAVSMDEQGRTVADLGRLSLIE